MPIPLNNKKNQPKKHGSNLSDPMKTKKRK